MASIILESKNTNLTGLKRRAIKAVLDAGLLAGQVGRTVYRLEPIDPNRYSVSVEYRETDIFGRLSGQVDKFVIRIA